MVTIPLPPPQRSAFDLLAPDARPLVEGFARQVAEGANWKVRKKTVVDLLCAAELVLREKAAAGQGNAPPDAVLLVYVAAILESLGEAQITSIEQAAIYALSILPEHSRAAVDWVKADRRNSTAFRKLLRADRRYDALFTLIQDASARLGTENP